MPTGGEVLVRGLELAGVEVVFGLPGVHNLAAWDALSRSPIRLVGVRHEQAAAYAADGYARATGRLGVALTTTGPGAANTLGAVGEAWSAGSPVLVIATDIATTLRRPEVTRGVLHECADQAGMFRPVVKHIVKVKGAEQLPGAVAAAIAAAVAAPQRPVYLEVPTDVLAGEVDGDPQEPKPVPVRPVSETDLDLAAMLLAEAERPLVWAGGGAVRSGAGEAVADLAERLATPVITTYLARGLLGRDHPCAVGLPPHVLQCGALWDEADLVVAIGSDLDGMMTQNWAMPQPKHLVAINVDQQDANKNYEADLVLVGDAAETVAALLPRLPERDGVDALAERLAGLRAGAWAELEEDEPRAVAFLDAFDQAVPEDAVVLCDMCIPGYWLAGFHPVAGPRRLQYPMGWGTLGFAFPAALGAALAGGGPVVSVSGDGGFLFACGELATVAQERLPLTAVIVDDGGYGMLRYDQQHAGETPFGTDLVSPDFEAMAASFGLRAETVEGLGDAFGEALARHVADTGPSVLVARAEQLTPPPTTSPRWYRRRR
jgi:thiamine pyrophosphate-dependent acetolactate synthase large subunit-like protein